MYVETQAITKHYGKVTALVDCTFGVPAGEVLGLLGPNGSGKTTLLRLLLGFLRPTNGTATIDGLDCCTQSLQVRRRLSYLPGDVRLFRRMRGSGVLDFFARIRPPGNSYRFRQFAERLNLDLSTRVASMSTGMRQKLGLAATLAAETPLLVLDEPTSHLDPSIRREVNAMVAEAKQAGRTVIFSSHVLSEVEEVCDRVVILRAGRLVHSQVISELKQQHRIHAKLEGPLPQIPEPYRGQISIQQHDGNQMTIDTPGELSGLFGWLSTLPLSEVTIQPRGLRAVYERFHAE